MVPVGVNTKALPLQLAVMAAVFTNANGFIASVAVNELVQAALVVAVTVYSAVACVLVIFAKTPVKRLWLTPALPPEKVPEDVAGAFQL
jgi:hypothetical protein